MPIGHFEIGDLVYRPDRIEDGGPTSGGEVIGFGMSHDWIKVRTFDGKERLWSRGNIVNVAVHKEGS